MLALASDGSSALLSAGAGRDALRARIDLSPSRLTEARVALAALRSRRRSLRRGVILRLPAEAALHTTMTLPLAAQANLDQVVSFELDRRTPFKRDEVYHSQRVLNRDAVAKRVTVQLTVVPRQVVEQTRALADRLGLGLAGVDVAGADAAPVSGNLLPPRPLPFSARLPRVATAALALLAAGLLAAAALIPLEASHRSAATLSAALADSKRRADESLRLQKEIDAEVQESGFLAARKHQTPSVSEVLFALTHLLPDDAWLTELEVTNGEVRMTGFAESAASVLGLVDQSPHFANAAFRSPVTQDQRTKREQFNIGARLAQEKGS